VKENIEYQFSTSLRDEIVEIVITGILTNDTLEKLHAEVITIIRECNAKGLLADVRAAKGPNEITAAFFRVRTIPPDVLKLPAAIVELSENRDYQSFYETTAANIDQSMKFFTDIEAARAWLKGRFKK
jgi:hypothetical protein